jgi:hypothetical protein
MSATYQSQPELRLYLPIAFYLDALAEHFVQGRYLKLHVALEAFAFWISKKMPEEPPLIAVAAKWREWLTEQKERLRGLAGHGQFDALWSSLSGMPGSPRSSRLVKRVFKAFRDGRTIILTPEMKDELYDRNLIVHTAEMFAEGVKPSNVEQYIEKIELVRTLLVALISLVVDYQGEILGWKRERHQPLQTAPADWWSVSDVTRNAARLRYVVKDE